MAIYFEPILMTLAELAPYFYGAALVLTYQLLRTQSRKLIAMG